MKKIYDKQIGKWHYRTEYGDSIKLIVDEETAEKIRKENEENIQRAFESQVEKDPVFSIKEGLKAPREWHEKNFMLGREIPSYREISSLYLEENEETGEMQEIKSVRGFRGAVASGKKLEDGTIEWDWNHEEKDVNTRNLLDFYVIPDSFGTDEEYNKFVAYEPKEQDKDIMPSSEKSNPIMAWKDGKN